MYELGKKWQSGLFSKLLICFLHGVQSSIISGPSNAVVEISSTHELTCQAEDNDTVIWQEGASVLFVGTAKFDTGPKYANFYITGTPPMYNLQVSNAMIQDEGNYQCKTNDDNDGVTAAFSVEALTLSVSVDCSIDSINNCSQSQSAEFTCTCNAIGAHPGTLTLTWTDVDNSSASSAVSSTERPGFFDITGTAIIAPTEDKSLVSCNVSGYNIEDLQGDPINAAGFQFAPPNCNLSVSFDDSCTTAYLDCGCSGAIPDIKWCSYFYADATEAAVSWNCSIAEVDISGNETYTFSCRGCNGVNYGSNSAATSSADCTILPCTSNPCRNNGTCEDNLSGDGFTYNCTCMEFYIGNNCEIATACASYPCLNGGTCQNNSTGDGYNCTCEEPYSGERCEIPPETTTVQTTSEKTTTVPPTELKSYAQTTTELPMTTKPEPRGLPQAALIGIGVGSAVAAFLIIFIFFCWYCNREGNGSTSSTTESGTYQDHRDNPAYAEDPKDDGSDETTKNQNGNASQAAEDPAADLYGKIDKSRKSKKMTEKEEPQDPHVPTPENLDAEVDNKPNGTGPNEVSKPEAAPNKELQYADLDHGKAPASSEVRQPQNEETAYAEVNFGEV